MTEMTKAVKTLITKAGEQHDSADAMRFSQAACNTANALAVLEGPFDKFGPPEFTKAQINHMVDRFLGWRLPENFNPDGGISFERYGNAGMPHQYKNQPTGTNLLDSVQAYEMVRYMIEGL